MCVAAQVQDQDPTHHCYLHYNRALFKTFNQLF